jgi:hypothetical protein
VYNESFPTLEDHRCVYTYITYPRKRKSCYEYGKERLKTVGINVGTSRIQLLLSLVLHGSFCDLASSALKVLCGRYYAVPGKYM